MNERVTVYTCPYQEAPTRGAPFVLQISAINMYPLGDVVVIADRYVPKIVIVILEAGYKFRRHEEETGE